MLVEAFDAAPKLADGTPDIEGIEINGKYHPISSNGWHEYRAWDDAGHDRFFANLVRAEAMRIAEHLVQKRWSIVLADTDTFITTDKPVGLQHQQREKFGIETQGTIVTFPISPRRILILDDMHSEPANQYYPTDQGEWRGVQRYDLAKCPPVSYHRTARHRSSGGNAGAGCRCQRELIISGPRWVPESSPITCAKRPGELRKSRLSRNRWCTQLAPD
jgi:hypothetical protein